MSLFTWILSGPLELVCVWGGHLCFCVRTLSVFHVVLILSYKPLTVDYSTRSFFFVFCSCPEMLYWPFSLLHFSPHLLSLFSLCCCLTLLSTLSFLAPINHPNHPPMFLFLCLSLLSWWASQEAVHPFEDRNLLFLSVPFPFQSSVHSWNQGTLHADEHALTSSKMYIQTRDWQERVRGKREKKRERGALEIEEWKIMWWSKAADADRGKSFNSTSLSEEY